MLELIAVIIILLWFVGIVGAHSIAWLIEALVVIAIIALLLKIIRL